MLKSCSEIIHSAKDFTSALFVAHAKADRVTSVHGSEKFVDKAGSACKTLRIYESSAHDLLGNPKLARQVSTDMLDWVEQRVAALMK